MDQQYGTSIERKKAAIDAAFLLKKLWEEWAYWWLYPQWAEAKCHLA